MEHVVFYQSTQGAPAFRRLSSLEDAVSFAEHLRNVEGVTDFSVYSLSPVTLSLRAYYHVEVSTGDAPTAAADAPPGSAQPPAGAVPTGPPPMPEQAVSPESAPPLPPDAPPAQPAFDAAATTPAMSFNALEEEATAPLGQMPAPAANVPFAAAPLPPPTGVGAISETFVKDDPADLPPPAPDAAEAAALDPNITDPTTEEVAPAAPSGRRSMGFFARS